MTRMDKFTVGLLVIGILAFISFGSFMVGIRISQPDIPPVSVVKEQPTGQEVLTELQKYRKSNGLSDFQLSDLLCNNIGERWQNYYLNNNHEGWSDFMARNYPSGFTASEILVSGESAEIQVKKWSESPSHNEVIKKAKYICVYSYLNSSVALLSY